MRNPGPVAAQKLARQLATTAHAWARTILICVGRRDAELEDTLAEETLAYTLCLLDARVERFDGAFLEQVRAECQRLQAERAWRMANRYRRLPAANSQLKEEAEFSRRYLQQVTQAEAGYGPTDDTFHEFCRATGLHSSVLLGRGENLAALVFYIVVHGCLSCRAPLTRRQTTELLRATRECRVHTEAFLNQWLADRFAESPLCSPALKPAAAARQIAPTAG